MAIACKLSGILVLDLDVDLERGLNGIETIQLLEQKLGKLPLTLTQRTPRGGMHLIFSDEGIVQPIGKIEKDCDVKWNGYILCEPSSINGKTYKFTNGIDEKGNITIAKLPQAWLNYLNKTRQNTIILQNSRKKCYQRRIIDGDFKKMYDNFRFIKYCVDCASKLDEPSWHLFACVLSSLSNGEELFDYYSRPYPDYDQILTKKKFQNAKKYATCKNISCIFADCARCKYRKGKTNE